MSAILNKINGKNNKVEPFTENNSKKAFLMKEKTEHFSLLSDPVFTMSKWIGAFHLTDELKKSYKLMALGVVVFLFLKLERVLFLIYYHFQQSMRAITMIYVMSYTINWLLALFRPGNDLRSALKELAMILQKLDVEYRTLWLFYTPFCFLAIKFIFNFTNGVEPFQLLIEILHLLLTAPSLLLPLQYAAFARQCSLAFAALKKKLPSSDTAQLQRLSALHCRLCHLSDSINRHYGPTLLVTIVLLIALSMSFIYLLVSNSDNTTEQFVKMSLRIAYVTCAALSAVYSATQVSEESQEFNEGLKNALTSRRSTDNENLRVYIKLKMGVNPTACGFFSLKPKLFIGIIAGLISYTVVLLQFSGKSKIPISA